jgi:O-6-methylguanine DNA methyltransferase
MKIRISRFPPARVAWSLSSSPVGKLAVGGTEKGEICRVSFVRGGNVSKIIAAWRKKWPQTLFYKGEKSKILTHAPILLIGTEFQGAVWRAIAKIPKGNTRTYSDLARCIKKPNAVRAVGGACGANPVPFFIPCHRVVAAKGLGGFSGGLDLKRALLKIENASIL